MKTEFIGDAGRSAVIEDIMRAGDLLDRARKALEVHPKALRATVNAGLRLIGADQLRKVDEKDDIYELPPLDKSWERTLDSLRFPMDREESFFEWRRKPLKQVTFRAPDYLASDLDQLHLSHPFVQRLFSRFLAQGFRHHDISRVCGVTTSGATARVALFARLTHFGHGASRLHDQIISVAAPWKPGKPKSSKRYKDRTTERDAIKELNRALSESKREMPKKLKEYALNDATLVFDALWPELRNEADASSKDALIQLNQRSRKESEELRLLLERQQKAIRREVQELSQMTFEGMMEKEQKRQVELDEAHLRRREVMLEDELHTEPEKIVRLYQVRYTRVSPVGMVFGWPEGAA